MDSIGTLDSMLDRSTMSEARITKLRRSCESCRTSKGRCCPSIDEHRCQKCLKEGKQCIFLQAKPRPKRSKNSRTRVAEMEQKLESLYALLSAGTESAKELTSPSMAVQADLAPAFSFETNSSYQPGPFPACHRKTNQQFPIFSLPFLVLDDIQDVISKGIVSFDRAEDSIRLFRTKASNFPFVVIPPQTSLDTLRREKPFLLLAILAFGAQTSSKLQSNLEEEILETLGKRVFVGGEKSLDILQGLLVYLTWYHLYFDPGRQQVYQLSQMTATMAIDLGLHKRVQDPELVNCSAIGVPWNATPHVLASRMSSEEIESRRTFLGCYYLSCCVSISLRKPNMIRYCEYIEECSQVLAHSGDSEYDYLIPYHIRLQRFVEDINRAFEYDTGLNEAKLDAVRVEILSQNFRQQLTEMEMSFPPEIWTNATITTAYYTSKVYLYEVGFHTNASSSLELMSAQSGPQSWHNSSTRNDNLIACLQAAKEYVERLLQFPPTAYYSFTLHDYVRLIYVILILGRFSSGCGSPTLDSDYLRKSANLDRYLTELIAMTEPLFPSSNETDVPSYIHHVKRLFQASKAWLKQVSTISLPAPDSISPELSFMNVFPTIVGCMQVMELSTTTFGLEERPDGLCVVLPDVDSLDFTSVDPSMVMIGGNDDF